MTYDELKAIDRLFVDLIKGNHNERLINKVDRILTREIKLKEIEMSYIINEKK